MRSLIVDLARKVDSTAHMTSLRRTVQGRFSIDYLGQVTQLSTLINTRVTSSFGQIYDVFGVR